MDGILETENLECFLSLHLHVEIEVAVSASLGRKD